MVNILIEMSEERNTRKNMERWERIFTDFSELNLTGKSEINAEELPTRERLAGWAQEIQSGDRRKKLQENVARTLKDMKEEKRTRRNIAHWERIAGQVAELQLTDHKKYTQETLPEMEQVAQWINELSTKGHEEGPIKTTAISPMKQSPPQITQNSARMTHLEEKERSLDHNNNEREVNAAKDGQRRGKSRENENKTAQRSRTEQVEEPHDKRTRNWRQEQPRRHPRREHYDRGDSRRNNLKRERNHESENRQYREQDREPTGHGGQQRYQELGRHRERRRYDEQTHKKQRTEGHTFEVTMNNYNNKGTCKPVKKEEY